jgi:hypothetical protein
MRKIIVIVCLFLFSNRLVIGQNINHSSWTNFLQKYVSHEGQVNYQAIKVNVSDLKNYLNLLAQNTPNDSWSKNEKLAYWINAYNAFTIKLITDNLPLTSIKDIKNPWDQEFIQMNGEMISLNYIEHEILRNTGEPRIHFAIVCASESCPKLQNEAFVADKLEEQLTQATNEFLNDDSKNKISFEELELSKIFKWFSKDFKQNGSLIDFINKYSEVNILDNAKITYIDYSWKLNGE